MFPFSLPKKLKELQSRFSSVPAPRARCAHFPAAAVAGGVQLCVHREGRVPCPGCIHSQLWEHLSQPGPAQQRARRAVPGLSLPRAPLLLLQPPHGLHPSSAQAAGPRGEFSLGETSLCFIWEIIKMKHGGFPCSVVYLEKREMTAAVLC